MERRRVLQIAAVSAIASFWDSRLKSSLFLPTRKKVINIGFIAPYAQLNHLHSSLEALNNEINKRTAGEYVIKIHPRSFSEPNKVLAALKDRECDFVITSPPFWQALAPDLHPVSHGPNTLGKEKYLELIASESFQSDLNSIYKQINLETETINYLYGDRIRLSTTVPSPENLFAMTFASSGWMSQWLESQRIRVVQKTRFNDLAGVNVTLPIPHYFFQRVHPKIKQNFGFSFIDADSAVPHRIELAHLPVSQIEDREMIETVKASLKTVLPGIFAAKKQHDELMIMKDFGNIEVVSLNKLNGGTLSAHYSQSLNSNILRPHFA